MAEAVFRDLVNKAGLGDKIKIDSSGTGSWNLNEPPYPGTQKILKRYGIGFDGQISRLTTSEDLSQSNYIICMDNSNMTNVRRFGDVGENYFGKLSDFVPDATWSEVPDPYYTGDFDVTYELVLEGCEHLLKFIREQHSL